MAKLTAYVAGEYVKTLVEYAEISDNECAAILSCKVEQLRESFEGLRPVPTMVGADYTELTRLAARRRMERKEETGHWHAIAFRYRGELYKRMAMDKKTHENNLQNTRREQRRNEVER